MSGIERTRSDVVEGNGKGDRDRRSVVESPEDGTFKGATKGKRDRASQLVQRYGRHST